MIPTEPIRHLRTRVARYLRGRRTADQSVDAFLAFCDRITDALAGGLAPP